MSPTKKGSKPAGLKGKLDRLPWVTVSRKAVSKAARDDQTAYGVRSFEDIAQAFGRRERDSHEA